MAKVVSFAVPDGKVEIWHRFVAISRREAKSVSQLIMSMIEDYVRKHGEGNPAVPLDKWVENEDFVAFPTLGERPTIRKLRRMDGKMLEELFRNASEYADAARYMLLKLDEHRHHAAMGLKLDSCPYCSEE